MRPYQQLMQCALNIRRNDYAARYFNEFRSRMLAAEGENLLRNKSYLYEMGYLWKANTGAYAESIQYSDSLIRLIESGKGYFSCCPTRSTRPTATAAPAHQGQTLPGGFRGLRAHDAGAGFDPHRRTPRTPRNRSAGNTTWTSASWPKRGP